ncbi:unnamed protein product [Vicia faba]|uniref:Uncharacterized protein n=1 Tax=Vicia faba TaxID=3906 RepID=A0AAV1AMI7_VICFA|nr:unnamed protein product [Vicia faba]
MKTITIITEEYHLYVTHLLSQPDIIDESILSLEFDDEVVVDAGADLGVNETIVDDDMAEVGVNEDVMHEGFNLGVNKMLWMKEMT